MSLPNGRANAFVGSIKRTALGNFQIIADNTEDYLRHQLLANGNFTIFGDPDAHGGVDRISGFTE